ncbi:MAG: hypothetical protein K1X53_05790 [Candidatus Sumerlaeaceae bacterium]|nr:hypothetical protein [Candidatus Sumerlaeaceae bacterium]
MTEGVPQPNETERMSYAVFEKAGRYMTKVAARLQRAAASLEDAHIPYAVIGGNAVMSWVARADETAIRPTQDVDILLERSRLDQAKKALETVGFHYRHVASIDMFLDGPEGKAREAIHVIFAGELVRPDYLLPAPQLAETTRSPENFSILSLQALVRMKLTSYRLKDQVHLQDLVSVGLVTSAWLDGRYPPVLEERLKRILDNPEA